MNRPFFTYYLLQPLEGKIADAVIFLSYIKENTAINRRVGIKFANYQRGKSVLFQDTALLNQTVLSVVNHITVINTGKKAKPARQLRYEDGYVGERSRK